jgi:hypothetical protein
MHPRVKVAVVVAVALALAVVVAVLVVVWVAVPVAVAHRGPAVDAASCAPAVSLGPTCGSCVAAYCCAELSACWGAPDCIDLNDCVAACEGDEALPDVSRDECPTACESRHAPSVATFRAWDTCARARCERECDRDER